MESGQPSGSNGSEDPGKRSRDDSPEARSAGTHETLWAFLRIPSFRTMTGHLPSSIRFYRRLTFEVEFAAEVVPEVNPSPSHLAPRLWRGSLPRKPSRNV